MAMQISVKQFRMPIRSMSLLLQESTSALVYFFKKTPLWLVNKNNWHWAFFSM